MKILIVEDELDLLESIKTYLENEDMHCEVASDFRSAINKISGFCYDVILLDITLPDGNGLDVLKLIKKEGLEAKRFRSRSR